MCPGTVGFGVGGLVFGTLLGPEATGPGVLRFLTAVVPGTCLFLVSWLHRSHALTLSGLCVGCVVWGCCLRTT